jgi:predicted ester cyclase
VDSTEAKALARKLIEGMDANYGSIEFLDEVLSEDLQLHFNGAAMRRDEYKQMMPVIYAAFTDVRHEIHLQTAENDIVTNVITIHARHVGEWEGVAATDRTVSFSDIAVIHLRLCVPCI